ncbi:MAG: hypothetical protein H6872_05915 [Methylobacteriaceae bacterium]|nr:hypothetical protein [Methylobacteriaceae bacterium]
MNVRVDPDRLLYEDLADRLPLLPALLEWGSLPHQQPFLTCFREHLPRELLLESRVLVWRSGQKLRAGVRCYRTLTGRPANYVFAEAVIIPAAFNTIRAMEFIDVWVFRDRPGNETTEGDVQLLMAAVIAK